MKFTEEEFLMVGSIPRVLPFTESAKQFYITSNIYGLTHPQLARRCDALFITNGRDEKERLRCGAGIWQEHTTCSSRYLFIARSPGSRFLRNVRSPKDLSQALHPGVLSVLFGRTKGVILSEQLLEDTKQESLWAADLILEYAIKSIAFVTSPEHVERVLRTFVHQLGLKNIRIPIVPVNTRFIMPPSRIVEDGEDGESSRTGSDYYPGESERLSTYTENTEDRPPDVASFDEMREYFDWLDAQPITRGISCI